MHQDAGKDKLGSCPLFWAPLQKKVCKLDRVQLKSAEAGGLEDVMSEQNWKELG